MSVSVTHILSYLFPECNPNYFRLCTEGCSKTQRELRLVCTQKVSKDCKQIKSWFDDISQTYKGEGDCWSVFENATAVHSLYLKIQVSEPPSRWLGWKKPITKWTDVSTNWTFSLDGSRTKLEYARDEQLQMAFKNLLIESLVPVILAYLEPPISKLPFPIQLIAWHEDKSGDWSSFVRTNVGLSTFAECFAFLFDQHFTAQIMNSNGSTLRAPITAIESKWYSKRCIIHPQNHGKDAIRWEQIGFANVSIAITNLPNTKGSTQIYNDGKLWIRKNSSIPLPTLLFFCDEDTHF